MKLRVVYTLYLIVGITKKCNEKVYHTLALTSELLLSYQYTVRRKVIWDIDLQFVGVELSGSRFSIARVIQKEDNECSLRSCPIEEVDRSPSQLCQNSCPTAHVCTTRPKVSQSHASWSFVWTILWCSLIICSLFLPPTCSSPCKCIALLLQCWPWSAADDCKLVSMLKFITMQVIQKLCQT